MNGKIRAWLASGMDDAVTRSVERVAALADVQRVAIMPDVHLAEDVCVGCAVATRTLLLPAAVGGDIGCGMVALRFHARADLLKVPNNAAQVLKALYARVPAIKHAPGGAPEFPLSLVDLELSSPALERLKLREGTLEFGTLGRGNHFLEFQEDDAGWLWLMLHSGSRAMGPAVRHWHSRRAVDMGGALALSADSDEGKAYLQDAAWAVAYAAANRRAMADRVVEVLRETFNLEPDEGTRVDCNHNHVRQEVYDGELLWVHRKGALSARLGEVGVIPGSMGSRSHHVEGRGCADALHSCSHGAGRMMSRTEARRRISAGELHQQMGAVLFDHRRADALRDEAPGAYKDIGAVMRAQRDLVRVTATLVPVLSYKGV